MYIQRDNLNIYNLFILVMKYRYLKENSSYCEMRNIFNVYSIC